MVFIKYNPELGETGKSVSILIGADVAAFFLRFGAQLLG